MQTRTQSFIETCINTAIGYLISLLAQLTIFPMFGIHVPFHSNLMIGAAFTVVSIARGFFIRRLFNWLHSTRKARAA
ncbi:DUF7220 family protein [Paraburkholderia phenoliruptrix]|uniref:DUF7220 family protein n=1 Tax=Paraburkholderia phenoliruptrix TaxID=252970 RepID=UPI0034CF788A